MNNNDEDSLYLMKDIQIIIDSKKININSGEIYLYLNHIILSTKNKTKKFKINYKDITFHAIEKQKRLIILCDMNKYNIINIICNTQEEINELFNQLCICINDNNNINIDNVELEEEGINNEKLLEEWEKKIDFQQ